MPSPSMPTRPHHAPPASLTGDNPAALPYPGRSWSGTSDQPGSAILRTYLLLTAFVLPLSFACQGADTDADTISDPQGCRSIRFIAETDSDPNSEATTIATTTETMTETTATATATDTKPGTDSDPDSTSSTTIETDSDTTTNRDPVCGNSILEDGEDCDDGNTELDKECPPDCKYHCGDGIAHGDPEDGGEECDAGDKNGVNDLCSDQCTLNCGDGVIQGGVEECDNGDDKNGVNDPCSANCTLNCGDGVKQPLEQCDDGNNGDDLDSCTDECTLRYTVFVTSQTYAGDLSVMGMNEAVGLDRADSRCQTLADAAGWKNKGKFRAWLSDSTGSPSTRFETAPKAMDDPGFEGIFALPDGTEVAVGWKGLTTADNEGNLLLHAIDMDENGDLQTNIRVWTNTTVAGMQKQENPEYHCLGWTTNNDLQYGRRGSTNNYLDKQWTDFRGSALPCDSYYRLYCFQVTNTP